MFVTGFSEISLADLPDVGGKGANLGEMTRAGLPVPPGFCLTAKAYRHFIAQTGISNMIEQLENLKPNNLAATKSISEQITSLILNTEVPRGLSDLIIEAFDQNMAKNSYVAVRSSATAEDLPEASFAGQQESFLYVYRDNLLAYIRKCWASLWTERAIHYRQNNGFDHRKVCLAVVVQEMVHSEVSGVAFSINPINRKDSETVIESVWGLGEGIVSGQLSPDRFVVDKLSETIIEMSLAEKSGMIVHNLTGDGTNLIPVPEQQRTLATLTDRQVLTLLRLVKQIEAHYQEPQDIEWAFAANRFYILQSRPITTLNKGPALPETEPELFNFDPKIEWTNSGGVKERYHKPLSPLGWSLLEPCQTEGGLYSLKLVDKKKALAAKTFVANIYGYLYINFSSLRECQPLSLLKPYLAEDATGEFKPERSKLKDLYWSIKSYRAGTKMIRSLDKVFYDTLPDYLAEIDKLSLYDLAGLSDLELLSHIKQYLELAKSYFRYQTSSLAVAEGLYNMLAGLLAKSLKADLGLCSKLVSGLNNNLTVEISNDVWRLAKLVRESQELRALLESLPTSVFLQQAAALPAGQSFLAKLTELLNKHGHVNLNMDIATDFWWENPDIVLSMVKGFLTQDETFDPPERERLKQKERTETEQMVRSRLNPMQRVIFNKLLALTQAYVLLRDNRHYYVTMPFSLMKKGIRQLATRLNEKDYLEDQQIFHLTLAEIEQLIQGTLSKEAARELIRRRAGAREISLAELPPFIKGWPKLVGLQVQASDNSSTVLSGVAGSPGTVSGPVKIVRSPADFSAFRAGDILVAVSTDPAWTPLFAIAKAVITEYGGMLSHGAIVAREYNIPAVLNVKNATSVLKDGQVVTVDGNRGRVSIH